MSGLSNTQQAFLMLAAFLIPVLTSVSAWATLGMPTDRAALGTLVAAVLGNITAGLIVFSKEIAGGTAPTTTSNDNTPTSPAKTQLLIRRFSSKFKLFLSTFVHDTVGMPGKHRRHKRFYDPAPPRRHKGHRKGIEPAGLKRWRLSHRRTADPGYRSSFWKGRRGGHYFQGPHKRRYDPAPRRRYTGYHPFARRAGSGIEKGLNGWIGSLIGFFAALGWGVYGGYNTYETASPGQGWNNYSAQATQEYKHLYSLDKSKDQYWLPDYLRYKFLGQNPDGSQAANSAWVMPFWTFTVLAIVTAIANRVKRLGKIHRITRPLCKVSTAGAIGSAVGALFLPGCGNEGPTSQPQQAMVNRPQSPQINQTFQG